MKKAVKIIIIVLLVIAVVAGTCFLFFLNRKKEEDKAVSLLSFAESEEKQKLETELNNIIPLINSDSTDNRFAPIAETISNLNNSYDVLTTYYLESNFIVENQNIANSISTLNGVVSTSLSMIDQYKIKANHVSENGNKYFNRHLGANDLYASLSNYIVEYSNLIVLVNNGITNVNKTADVKFAVINVYADVATKTFSGENIETNANLWKTTKNANGLTWLNQRYNIEHLYLKTNAESFTYSGNKFTQNYNECDTLLFADKLYENVSNVNELNENLSKEEIATYYFKKVMG